MAKPGTWRPKPSEVAINPRRNPGKFLQAKTEEWAACGFLGERTQ